MNIQNKLTCWLWFVKLKLFPQFSIYQFYQLLLEVTKLKFLAADVLRRVTCPFFKSYIRLKHNVNAIKLSYEYDPYKTLN